MEDFIVAFLLNLGEHCIVSDLSLKNKILEEIIHNYEDFNHIKLFYKDIAWIFPLPNSIYGDIVIKEINIYEFM